MNLSLSDDLCCLQSLQTGIESAMLLSLLGEAFSSALSTIENRHLRRLRGFVSVFDRFFDKLMKSLFHPQPSICSWNFMYSLCATESD